LAKGDGFAFQKNVAIAAAQTSGAIAHIMPKSLGDNKDVKAHHLLVLLLRLRQVETFLKGGFRIYIKHYVQLKSENWMPDIWKHSKTLHTDLCPVYELSAILLLDHSITGLDIRPLSRLSWTIL
jgi:hypothetical protein